MAEIEKTTPKEPDYRAIYFRLMDKAVELYDKGYRKKTLLDELKLSITQIRLLRGFPVARFEDESQHYYKVRLYLRKLAFEWYRVIKNEKNQNEKAP